jgi:hypothetical protein
MQRHYLPLLAALAVAASAEELPVSPPSVSAGGRATATLQLPRFGRVSVACASPAGARLRLLDRMLGVVGEAGVPGQEDGRLDLFLERGEYRLEVETPPLTSGQVRLLAREFQETSPTPFPTLEEGQLLELSLGDFEQRSFWLHVPASREGEPVPVPIQVAGRALGAVHLWRGGVSLEESPSETATSELGSGQPLRVLRLAPRLQPGWYQLVVYGGPPLPWSSETQSFPLFLQVGVPHLPPYLRHERRALPFGCSFFRFLGNQTQFRLELPEPREASLWVGPYDPAAPFALRGDRGELAKNARLPVVQVFSEAREGEQGVAVCTAPGQSFTLQSATQDPPTRRWLRGAWVFVAPLGDTRDQPPAMAALAKVEENRRPEEPTLVTGQFLQLAPGSSWQRSFDLPEAVSLFLQVPEPVSLRVEVEGASGELRLAPLTMVPGSRPLAAPWPTTVELPQGIFELWLLPRQPGKVTVSLQAQTLLGKLASTFGLEKLLPLGGTVLQASLPWTQFAAQQLDPGAVYRLVTSLWEGSKGIVVFQPLPWDTSVPLPVVLAPGESRSIPVAPAKPVVLQAQAAGGQRIPLAVGQSSPQETVALYPGEWSLTLTNPTGHHLLVVLQPAPPSLLGPAPPPPGKSELAALQPAPLPLDRPALASTPQVFTLELSKPGLYRLETLGPWRTAGVLRTRTGKVAEGEGNGVGENFLLQPYLREGSYQLAVTSRSRWREIPVLARKAPVREGGELELGRWQHLVLPASEAVALRFAIPAAGSYGVTARTLGGLAPCRLEDEAGWPVASPRAPCNHRLELFPGSYRLLLLPTGREARVKVAVRASEQPAKLAGHGPHPLPLGVPLQHLWREPEEGQPRTPDTFRFTLPARARVRVAVTGAMTGTCRRLEAPEEVHRVEGGKPLEAELAPGTWELALTAREPDNLLPYTVSVEPQELLAGSSRSVVAPVSLPVAVGESPITELFSDGEEDVRASLFDAKGKLVASNDDGPASWDFHLALPLPPGRYTLRVEPVEGTYATTRVGMAARPEEPLPAWSPGGARELVLGEKLSVLPLALPRDASLVLVQAKSSKPLLAALRDRETRQLLAFHQGQEPVLAAHRKAGEALELLLLSLGCERATVALSGFAGTLPATPLAPMASWGLVKLGETGWYGGKLGLPGGGVLAFEGEVLVLAEKSTQLRKVAGVQAVSGSGLAVFSRTPSVGVRPAVLRPQEPLRFSLEDPDPVPLPVEGVAGPVLLLAKGFPSRVGVSLGSTPVAGPWTVDGTTAAAFASAPRRAWCWLARKEQASTVELSLLPLPAPRELSLAGGTLAQVLEPSSGVQVSLPPPPQHLRLLLPPGTVALLEGPGAGRLVLAADEARAEETVAAASKLSVWSFAQHGAVGARITGSGESSLLSQLAALFARREDPGLVEGFWVFPATGGGSYRWPLSPLESPRRLRAWQAARPLEVLLPSGQVLEGDDLELPPGGGELLLTQGEEPVALWITRLPGTPAPEKAGEQLTLPARVVPEAEERAFAANLQQSQALHLLSRSPVFVKLRSGQGEPVEAVLPFGGTWAAPASGEVVVALRCLAPPCQPVELWSTPAPLLREGVNLARAVAPGETAFFQLRIASLRQVGVGVRCKPDRGQVTLRRADGSVVGEGTVLMPTLPQGTYLLAVTAPADGQLVEVQPVVAGLVSYPSSPPEELVRCYPQLALGLVPSCPPPPPPPAATPPLPWEREKWEAADEDRETAPQEEDEL